MKQIKFIFGTLFVVIAFLVLIIPSLAEAGKNKAERPAALAPVILEAIEDTTPGAEALDIQGLNLVFDGDCPEVSLGGFPIPSWIPQRLHEMTLPKLFELQNPLIAIS